MSDFPRALFLTPAAFNHLTGGGVTFSNLFAGWPKDRLATAHTDGVPTSSDVCTQFFQLGDDEIGFHAPLRLLRGLRGERTADVRTASATLRPSLLSRLQGDSVPQRVEITPALDRWISAFKPELLYTILGSNAFMVLADLIRRRYGIPTVIHMMDDWPEVIYRRGVLAPFERLRMQRFIRRSVSNAALNMGIGNAMCDAFSQRYGRPFVPFQNCVDTQRWQGIVRQDSGVRGAPPKLMYFGSIFENAQLASLIAICRAVARLNTQGFAVRLEIASPPFLVAPYRLMLELHPEIRLVEPTQDDGKFYTALAGADALILPVNFDPVSVAFVRYSMPTKMPAYMASGTPVLLLGPRGVAQVDYAVTQEWGYVVDTPAEGAIDAAIMRILTDSDLRERLRTRAQDLATQYHDTVRVRTAFQSALKRAVRNAA